MTPLSDLYGEVDNLTGFLHPHYGRTFSFMSDAQVLETAENLVAKISDSEYRQIVVSETGAQPLAYVCEELLKRKSVEVQWTYMKFPREPMTRDISPIILFYLTDEERKERADEVKKICSSIPATALRPAVKPLAVILEGLEKSGKSEAAEESEKKEQSQWQRALSEVLRGTSIARTLAHPFLFFDEYLDSGITLQNAERYFRFFAENLDFRILSYFVNISESSSYPSIFHTEFDRNTQLACYERGAYPFENRVDLIGYLYYIDNTKCLKVSLEELRDAFQRGVAIQGDFLDSAFLEEIEESIEKEGFLNRIQKASLIPQVSGSLTREDIVRYSLAVFERDVYGTSPVSEFLWQLFEMYGPIWSPLPDEYHLDFLQAFEAKRNEIVSIPEFASLREKYRIARPAIVAGAAKACLERKHHWQDGIRQLLKEGGIKNGNRH